jgi:hypothetical protein
MTAFSARKKGLTPRGSNRKDGGRVQMVSSATGFWGLENFMPTRTAGYWLYTWQGLNCPVFKVFENDSEIKVRLEGGEMEVIFFDTPHINIKDFLDDQILKLMRLQSDIDDPLPMIGQKIGPEIEF